ncbi:carbon starvation protein A, partial [Candidatus Bathyarchaeota archaeon]
YMDGIRFFPVSKYVLYGFQFKGIAGLGPIFGPFIALFYGWIPALLWILVGNFFIGWIHDYSSLMLSVRNEGKTMGPLTYEIISPRARSGLMGFLLFYLILITAVFIYLCSAFFGAYGESVWAMIFLMIGGVISGAMLYRLRTGVAASTITGLIIVIIGIVIGVYFPITYGNWIPFLDKNLFWIIFTCIILFIAAITPLVDFTHPVIYLASYPAIFGIMLLIFSELISPITNVPISQPEWIGVLGASGDFWGNPGPIWPILMVSIACGAISGWHSLVSTSGSAGQLDVETDALPVGGGAMIMEGLLALASLGAFMVLASPPSSKALALVEGAKTLLTPIFGEEAAGFIQGFYGMWLELYALTIEMLVMRFFTMAMKDVTSGRPSLQFAIANKYVAAIIVLFIGGLFAYSGAWINLWLLFGGSNQLLAGLALILVSIYLVKVKKPSAYTLIPAIFMIITCEAALLYEGAKFFYAVFVLGKPFAKAPLSNYPELASALNIIFGIIGFVLFILGLVVAYDAAKALGRARREK